MELQRGEKVFIQSFKHDGSLHRTWAKGTVLYADDEQSIVVTYKTWVVESDGRRWFTREPAVCFFYDQSWYNVISMIRKTGIYFYCNLASPSLYDGEAIKNIDYDLDVKLYPDGHYDLLDRDEFEIHQKIYHYGPVVVRIVEQSMQELLTLIRQKQKPFDEAYIMKLYQDYLDLQKEHSD